MGYKEKGIVQITCEMSDSTKLIYQNAVNMQPYQVPDSCSKVTYFTGLNQQSEFDVSLLKKIKNNEKLESDAEKEKERQIQGSNIEYEIVTYKPEMVYTDITETEMFGFPEISKNVLTSPESGLWAFHGLRKLKFRLSNLVERDDAWTITAILYFNKKDNDEIPAIRMEQDLHINKPTEGESPTAYELYAFVNTNAFGEYFDYEKQKILFSGFLEIRFTCSNEDINNVVYAFPVELNVNNTNYKDGVHACVPLKNKTVSIDFGTSSSCVAVEGENNIELLTLSASEAGRDDINIYENPTCIMIYRWKEIYQQWKKENEDFPLIVRGDLEEEELGKKKVQFDFGYSIKEYMNDVSDRELNAILTEIKMIPKMLQENIQTSVRPLVVQDKKTIAIVDSYEAQDDEKLDIVAFYGYILGKAINRVEKNRIFTKYQITYPVKFNEEVKRKMCASLEYGLRRSLPKPLRDATDDKGKPLFRVDAKYPEPVAYIGSICGKYLKIQKDEAYPDGKAQLFAVYDFGGGTLDYSFGIFAPDPEDPNSSMIYILGVDGDSNVGGELLIKKMSYWVYNSPTNISQFVENRVPFERPEGEVLPDDCPEELFNNTASAKSNVRKINERITRAIFEGKLGGIPGTDTGSAAARTSRIRKPLQVTKAKEATEKEVTPDAPVAEIKQPIPFTQKPGIEKIEFTNFDDESINIEVSYDAKEINEKLEKILHKTVTDFKASLERTFTTKSSSLRECGIDAFDIRDVQIFKAGNSSKNLILENIMQEEFPDNCIHLVDETNMDFMGNFRDANGDVLGTRPKQVAITPKTAVAFGQLKLSDYFVEDAYLDDALFNWYIGAIDRGTNEFKMIIDKANPQKAWIMYGRINSEDMKIYYTETLIRDGDDTRLRSVEIGDSLDEDCIRKYLYIHISDPNTVLGCVCARGEKPDDSSETFKILLK